MIGLIPAAGQASRWSHYYKEFLPIGNGRVLLDNAVDVCRKQGCSQILIISNLEKIQLHVNHFKNSNDILYKIQSDFSKDFLSALETGFRYTENTDGFLLVMPDTLFSIKDEFIVKEHYPISFGLFKTYHPEKFGVLIDNKISDKNKSLQDGKTIYNAWGITYFSSEASNFICLENFYRYEEAFSAVMKTFGYGTFELSSYIDFASYDIYKEWLFNEGSSTSKTLFV